MVNKPKLTIAGHGPHAHRHAHSIASALLVCVTLAGCGPEDPNGDACASLLPGDLVITEVFANPEGTDDGKEWLEIFNATDRELDLAGLELRQSDADDLSREWSHVVERGTITAGDYWVAGAMLDDLRPGHVDYGFGNSMGNLRNSDTVLAVACGADEIDSMTYRETTDAVSLALTGAVSPDYTANDNASNWCASFSEFPDGLGTPGAANDACGSAGRTRCNDGDTERDIIAPQLGDIVINEVMANPDAVNDAYAEWFELRVLGNFDLNGLQIGKTADEVELTIDSADCLPVLADTYILLARGADTGENGGLPEVDRTFTFGLTNSSGTLIIGAGGTTLDSVSWTSAKAGVSWSLDLERATPTANDDETSWCDATEEYGDGDKGTPGAVNTACPFPGRCQEGETMRASVAPSPGDLVITEMMADPSVSDTRAEWFEIYVVNAVDLNDLEMGKTDADNTLTSGACLHRDAGSYVLFARDLDSSLNGGLPDPDHVFSFALTNAGGSLYLGHGGALLDNVSWSSTKTGISLSLDPTEMSPEANDASDAWCDGVAPYGDGDLGSPGAENPGCS